MECKFRVTNNDCVAGVVSTFAGGGNDLPFRDNVAATSSRIAQPQAVYVESTGSVLVVEYFNYVRRVDTPGAAGALQNRLPPGERRHTFEQR